ncbi:hypothetical protein M413DRAFT_245007 [Hebeloma cylindrosporum]|uniref:Opi1-domain-containing protein n=1 Tax=Hebeloma cylindrosporum TaxID=76867 RepID=A0A0C2XKS7_HEBCY|nr:hypothetical protein M413DRAFT_245007 [Hebeloma cylindrosporum h7]
MAPSNSLDDQEESVRIAVKALGDMRNSGLGSRTLPALSTTSTSSNSNSTSSYTTSPPSSSQSLDTAAAAAATTASPPAFVSRMSTFPLVGSALRVYEHGKASSRVVKYGAEMVESSVKSISRPVIDRLPVNVNQIDEFACRQLDRLDRYRRPSATDHTLPPPSPTSSSSAMAISTSPTLLSASDRDRGRPKLKTKTLDGTAVDDEDGPDISTATSPTSPGRSKRLSSKASWRGGERGVPSWLEANSPFVAPPPPPPPDSRASTPTQVGDEMEDGGKENEVVVATGTTAAAAPESQVAQRSRWQAVLLEAGGLSAALSEESMRRLKYCLHWLQYATAHIDAQILILRDFTANLQPLPSHQSSTSLSTSRRPPISEEHMRKLTDVRRDIVHTIRQVVDVVSKYAGGALPEPARGRVRGFILKLPQRWASKAGGGGGAGGGDRERERERETVVVAAATGTGAVRRPGGQRRAAQRERGTGADSGGGRSGPSSRATSPVASPRVGRAVLGAGGASSSAASSTSASGVELVNGNGSESGNGNGGNTVSASAALIASQRILALATESLDMMRNVTGVVKESLDRADAYVVFFCFCFLLLFFVGFLLVVL